MSSDWLDDFREPPNSYQVRKGSWPTSITGVDGQSIPVRKDWVNEGFYYLIDSRNGFMPPIANLWGWDLRLKYTANTVKTYLQSLTQLFEYLDRHHFDLDSRFAALEPLKRMEVDQLVSALAWKKESGNIIKAKLSTYAHRLGTISIYLRFGFERYLDKVTDQKKHLYAEKKMERMLKWIEQAVPTRGNIQEATQSPPALSNEQLAVLRFAITPEAPHNPFSSQHDLAIRYRNAALVSLLIEAGIRPAELCMLEKSDLFPERQSIWVSKWSADSMEAHHNQLAEYRRRRKFPRKATVGHKTRGRDIKLSQMTLEMLQLYIDEHRDKLLAGKRRSTYLFLSAKDGGPITPSGVRSVVKTIATAFPTVGYLTSYTFRHTAVTVSAATLRKALSHVDALSRDQLLQEILTTKFGWSQGSDMPNHYGREDLNSLLSDLATASMQAESTYSAVPIIDNQRKSANDSF
ncbi:tyrosine-type recombinase/integrase [Neptunomonas qingdaonensis]|uniref:Site-specific recombinase XerD n=1 Tax=Neptunomonas qingdaonensis TaxID=1045558 RepID=A0A1I2R9G9_9GAMM|nr:tyrosine-type recombinase/integrase [Neptunomonas qingdaonensis]SFG37100.1 Site-specific recombinase XerD [Neptunomonas qingdaonensis]